MDNILDDGGIGISSKPSNQVSTSTEGITSLPIIEPTLEQKTFLDKFGSELKGKSFDKDGNLLSEDGKVVKNKTEVEQYTISKTIKPDEVSVLEIDGVEYTLNTEGAAIDKEGKVTYTKEQVDSFSDIEESKIPTDEVFTLTGYKIEDKEGKPVEYNFGTPKGIAEYSKDVLELHGETLGTAKLNAYFEANPEILEAHLYKRKHGTLDGFNESIDWSKISLSKDNEAQLEDIVMRSLVSKGNDFDTAKSMVGYLKTDAKLMQEAEKGLKYLDERKKADIVAATEMMKREAELENTRWIEKVNSVKDLVNRGEIDDLVIPEVIKFNDKGKLETKTKQDFVDYYLKKVYQSEDGKELYSQYEADVYNTSTSLSGELKDAFLRFVKGDISSLVKTAINRENVKVLRKLKSNTKQVSKSVTTGKSKVTLDG